MNGAKLLVIEDEQDISELIALHLQDLGSVTQVETGTGGLKKVETENWDAVILDLHLPGMDGIDVCRNIRNQGIRVPIIMLTARSTELDRVLGLEIGADDYLIKPFSALELKARVRALLRRTQMEKVVQQSSLTIKHGNLEINKRHRTVSINNMDVDLTAKEYELLCYFAENPEVAFSRSDLLDQVWGYHQGYEHTVNSHINRLRGKLQKISGREYIHTIWGVGYRFSACE